MKNRRETIVKTLLSYAYSFLTNFFLSFSHSKRAKLSMNYFTTLETKKRTPSFLVSSSKTKHNNLEKSNRRLPAIIEADIGGDKIIHPRKNRGGEYSFFLFLSSWFHAVYAYLPLFERALIPVTTGTSRRIETRKTQNEDRSSL